MERAALYVDGFNLYYAINELNQPHLKWLNLRALGELLIPSQSQKLVRIVYCSAYRKDDFGANLRHQAYVKALGWAGVECVLGHYITQPRDCRNCRHQWEESVEKETDVNLGVHLVADAIMDRFDHVYLLTADSDQAGSVRMVKERANGKRVTTVCPPGRPFSKAILRYADAKINLSVSHLERSLFERAPGASAGQVAAIRPKEYDPPAIAS